MFNSFDSCYSQNNFWYEKSLENLKFFELAFQGTWACVNNGAEIGHFDSCQDFKSEIVFNVNPHDLIAEGFQIYYDELANKTGLRGMIFINSVMGMKTNFQGWFFFEITLVLQRDVVFDSESNCRNLSSLAQTGGDKNIIMNFLQNDVISRRGRFLDLFFAQIIFLAAPGGARELKLRPFDSESKNTSGCSYSLISKKITPKSLFSFYQFN